MTDAVNQTNEILNPNNYIAPNGFVYIRVSNAQGCYNVAKVTLIVIPPVYSDKLKDVTILQKTRLRWMQDPDLKVTSGVQELLHKRLKQE